MPNDLLDTKISISVTPTEAHQFLTRLIEDDAFRDELEKNPAGVLAEHHISLPLDQLPGLVVVPSKDSIRASLHKFSAKGEIDIRAMFEPDGWPVMLFWWLYMTPAKPPHGKKGDRPHVASGPGRGTP
jgi:hypothetical protein